MCRGGGLRLGDLAAALSSIGVMFAYQLLSLISFMAVHVNLDGFVKSDGHHPGADQPTGMKSMATSGRNITGGGNVRGTSPVIREWRITLDDPEAYLNSFKHTAEVAGWPEAQWMAMLIPCLVDLAQQAVDKLPASDVADYKKVKDTIFQPQI